jgi:hypothetical protein
MGVLAALLLAAAPASAQSGICGNLFDLADEVSDGLLDELDDEFGVDWNDEEFCDELTRNFVKFCKKAVADAVACFQKAIKTASKQDKAACNQEFEDPGDCVNDHKEERNEFSDEVDSEGDFQKDQCETDNAEFFFEVCMFGFP